MAKMPVRRASGVADGGLEQGFTLIELMVVLLIIAILLAIAIPTFLGVSGSARDRSAQSNLTNAVTDVVADYQSTQSFDATASNTATSQDLGCSGTCPTPHASTAAALQGQEPAFTWADGDQSCTTANAAKCVSVLPVDVASANDGQGAIMAVMSGTGTCWYAMNLQTTPATAGYQAATGFFPGSTTSTVTTAGTYYAKESGSSVTCTAQHATTFNSWYPNYSSAVSE